MNADEELRAIGAAKADPHAFAPLYEEYHSTIFRFIHRRTNRRDLAADLCQQTFLKAMIALPRYQSRGLPFRAWLYRIALNELRMYWRKKKEVVMDLGWADVRPLADECGLLQQEEDMRLIASGLNRLGEDQARLIELRYFDAMSFVEVGQVLGITEDAAKMRTHRVIQQLRRYLRPER